MDKIELEGPRAYEQLGYLKQYTIFFAILFFLIHLSFQDFSIIEPTLSLCLVLALSYGALYFYPLSFFYSSLLFLGQLLCVALLAFEMNLLEVYLLGLIPCLFADLFLFHEDSDNRLTKGVLLSLVYLFLGAVIASQSERFENPPLFFILLALPFALSILKLQLRKNSPSSHDKIFVHDLINHTHGLYLHLSHFLMQRKPIPPEEVANTLTELKAMQSLIKDHYKMEHKNLTNTYELVDFEFLQHRVGPLLDHFFPNMAEREKIELNFSDKSDKEKKVYSIYFPRVLRIVTNLIKNMADHHAKNIKLDFTRENNNLIIQTSNSFGKMSETSTNLLEALEQEREAEKRRGLGLLSIEEITKQEKGDYLFKIENGKWVNQIILPLSKEDKKVRPTHKKVA